MTPDRPTWFKHPLDFRAKPGGELGLNGKFYREGEFMPFYIPREIMPQVDETDLPELISFLRDNRVVVRFERLKPEHVQLHQRVEKHLIDNFDPVLLTKPVLVSREPFVLDGNHRRMDHVIHHSPWMPTYRIMLEFECAIGAIFSFPKTYYYGDGVNHPIHN